MLKICGGAWPLPGYAYALITLRVITLLDVCIVHDKRFTCLAFLTFVNSKV